MLDTFVQCQPCIQSIWENTCEFHVARDRHRQQWRGARDAL